MNNFKNLADTSMHAGGLDLGQVQRLVWGWQGLSHPQEAPLASDSVARLFGGQPVPERDETITHAALAALLPTIFDKPALNLAFFKHDKVLSILAAYGSLCRMSPWEFVRTWAGEDLADFARELGVERRTLRRLEEAPWRGCHVSAPMLGALADLGRWMGAHAMPMSKLDGYGSPRNLAA